MKSKLIALTMILVCGISAYSMEVKGNFITETRFSLTNGDLMFNQENGNLKFEQQVNDNLYGMAQLGFKYYNNPISQTSYTSTLNAQEMGTLYSVQPLEISLDQAYFTYKDFIVEKLDLSAGKQRMAWGTADKLNPTDLLNANDYSDPFDFGKKTPSVAINLNYAYSDKGNIQFVYEPYSPVARLNSIMEDQTKKGIVSNLGENVSSINSSSTAWAATVNTPPVNASNFTIGTKVSGSLAGFDLSASYLTRMNDMPYISKLNTRQNVDFNGFPTSASTTNITLYNANYAMEYYREHVIGFDFSKDLDFILLWGEAAVTFPGEHKTSVTSYSTNTINGLPLLPAPYAEVTTNFDTVTISNEAYVKYTIGFDRSFNDSWYINFQYNHGFFTERGNNGEERLQDYLLLRVEKKFFSDKLKLAVTGMYNANNFADAFKASNFFNYLGDNYGVMGQFLIGYMPADNLTIELAITGLDGKDNSTLGKMKNYDMISTKFEYNF